MNSYQEPESDPAVLEYSHEPPLPASPANADLKSFAPFKEQPVHNIVQDARGGIKEEKNREKKNMANQENSPEKKLHKAHKNHDHICKLILWSLFQKGDN